MEALYQPFPMQDSERGQIWRYAPMYRRPRHFHAEPELNLVCAGTGTFGFGDRRLVVSAGDLLCWPPGQDHELIDASLDFDLFVIGVTPTFLERVLGPRASILTRASRIRLPFEELRRLSQVCAAPLARQDPGVIERRLGDVWRDAERWQERGFEAHTLTRRSLETLLLEPTAARAEIARATRSDPSDVSRYFRRDMGITLTTYRTRLRLLRFIELVDAGAPNLLSAASSAGFGSYSQCHRAFSGVLGCSPRVFFGGALRHSMSERFEPSITSDA